jgi:WhiB family redox-sensing transcriptional regulator
MAQSSKLPAVVYEIWDWQLQGACLTADPQLFFQAENERGQARQQRTAAALAVCASCPVIRECRRHGLSTPEPYGIWGGLTADERDAIRLLSCVSDLADRRSRRDATEEVDVVR